MRFLSISHLLSLLLASRSISCSFAQSPRTLSIINNCPIDYWFLPVSGAAPFSSPSISHCASDTDCIAGSSCLLPSPALCFWDLPISSTSSFHLPPSTTTSLTFPFIDNNNDVHWSGNIGFCQRGTCGPFPPSETASHCDSTGCSVYAGPSNIIEFTMSKAGTDYYDISNIAGVNVPLSFGPLACMTSPDTPYTCGTAGSTSSAFPSSWKFTPPTVYHQWVAAEGEDCMTNADCHRGLCGLTNVPGRSPQFRLQCGRHLGYWTANAACAAGVDVKGSPFDCSPNRDALMRCDKGSADSCYQPGASSSCCGCADWQWIISGVPSSTQHCVNSNPLWTSQVLSELQWLKAGVPNAYTYPYDDMSSTFICTQKDGHANHVDYEVKLCPPSTVSFESFAARAGTKKGKLVKLM